MTIGLVVRRLPAVVVLAAALAGCSTSADGGSDALASTPGPVPEGVEFRTPPAGTPAAPAFELPLLDGDVMDTAEQSAQRPIVLTFFESSCEPCREQQQEINDVAAEFGDAVLFLGIAGSSEPDDVREYVSENDVAYPVGTDPGGKIWFQYGVDEPPLVVLVSRGGSLVRGWPGGIGGNDLREQIEELAVVPHS
ncbi:MAG TPA: TlpA disulfide reductase family protein [Jiangellaceae bacterium]|nr:TlpA disulfide reductase family protein [Jiangellaceae bacterium]